MYNTSLFDNITEFLNKTSYNYQVGDLLEPERFSAFHVHLIIWTFSVLTYLLCIPLTIHFYRTRAYLNTVDYFSLQIFLCCFIAWIPAFILLIHHWLQKSTLKFCRFHYVLLSTNETVPILFVIYMVLDRFLYAYPHLKQKCSKLTSIQALHVYALFTWLLTLMIFALANPFVTRDSIKSLPFIKETQNYCTYNYQKLEMVQRVRSIFYFIIFVPTIVLLGFVLYYFYILRGTNQIQNIQKLWTIRATSLLFTIVLFDIYLYYLVNVNQTYKRFIISQIFRSSFFLVQLLIISVTNPHWLELILDNCSLCCLRRRKRNIIPPTISNTTNNNMTAPSSGQAVSGGRGVQSPPYASTTSHYSLVDEDMDDEFDQAQDQLHPTLRVI